MATHSFKSLMSRLSSAGFKKPFVHAALLPDWWDDDCSENPNVLPDFEIRVARFLHCSLSHIRNASVALSASTETGPRLRKVRSVRGDRLDPAIHTAVEVAKAVVRNLTEGQQPVIPSRDPLVWRDKLTSELNGTIQLRDILNHLWSTGIPVIQLNDYVPRPRFQALACVVDNHPVVVLGHTYEEPGRVAFLVAHEIGHITAGHCTEAITILDESAEVNDDSQDEMEADEYAQDFLVGPEVPTLIHDWEQLDARTLAQRASQLEDETGADASYMIYRWAAKTLDYPKATAAVRALYQASGAQRQLSDLYLANVHAIDASESDMGLLQCVNDQTRTTHSPN